MIKTLIVVLALLFTNVTYASGSWVCSSFIINGEGYLATAGHCVEHAKDMFVVIDKKWYKAELIASDYENDVAIIKINKATPDYFHIGLNPNSDRVAYILGYPIPDTLGYDLKIKKSKVIKDNGTYYQMGGGTCQGNSGGPVVNSSNDVIGVLTFGYGSQPCAYYVGVQKIQNVLTLAEIYDVKVRIDVASLPSVHNETDVRNKDSNKVPIFYGNE